VPGFCNRLLKLGTPASLLYYAGISVYPRTLEHIIQTIGIIDRTHTAYFDGYLKSRVRANTDKWHVDSCTEGRLVGEKHLCIFL
jgi:hypothetical protein